MRGSFPVSCQRAEPQETTTVAAAAIPRLFTRKTGRNAIRRRLIRRLPALLRWRRRRNTRHVSHKPAGRLPVVANDPLKSKVDVRRSDLRVSFFFFYGISVRFGYKVTSFPQTFLERRLDPTHESCNCTLMTPSHYGRRREPWARL